MRTQSSIRILAMASVLFAAACSYKSMREPSQQYDGDEEATKPVATSAYRPTPQPTGTPAAIANLPILAQNVDVPPAGLTPPNGKPYADMYFKHFGVNPTIDTDEEDTSTFSIDVDTASYSVSRSYLNRGNLPEEEAVRVEEFVNSFDYDYRVPEEETFSVQVEAFPSPNRKGYHVLHVGLKGKEVKAEERKPASLVFVIDVSGSMNMENRLGAVKKALALLVDQLNEKDRVGIVVFGDRAQVILDSTPATARNQDEIMAAISALQPQGSTNVQSGLKLGYEMASENLIEGTNRVILCGDGVANNGITQADAIFKTVEKHAKRGIALTTVGFGMGNYNDVLMERLAQIGDGNYAYVDRLEEAKKIFVEELTGTLEVIAKDVKIQLTFDPKKVARYRLLGFENRRLEKHEFDDDRVDAGEIGAGHTVTAMYEVKFESGVPSGDFAQLKIRHKRPEGGASALIEKKLPGSIVRGDYASASSPTKLSLCAAAFAEKLRGSYWVRTLSWEDLQDLYAEIPESMRKRDDVRELGELIDKAKRLDRRGDKFEKDAPIASMDFDNVPVLD